jgi:hypothetical protein
MPIRLLKRYEILDKNMKVVKDTGFLPCRSFVLQYLQFMEIANRRTTVSIKDVTNTAKNVDYLSLTSSKFWLECDAAATDDNYGIVVGTDNTAAANTDVALNTKIVHGTGAGELEYEAHDFTGAREVGANVQLDWRRTFHNDSGGGITVEETGLYIRAYVTGDGAYKYFMIIRDADTLLIADNATGRATFALTTTV